MSNLMDVTLYFLNSAFPLNEPSLKSISFIAHFEILLLFTFPPIKSYIITHCVILENYFVDWHEILTQHYTQISVWKLNEIICGKKRGGRVSLNLRSLHTKRY